MKVKFGQKLLIELKHLTSLCSVYYIEHRNFQNVEPNVVSSMQVILSAVEVYVSAATDGHLGCQ